MIRVQDLRAGYRAGFSRRWREVLKGVSFAVPRGSIAGYLGVNGAGKTTTIKVLVGINPPAGGTVTIGGHPAGSPAAQRALGYFPEAPFFYDSMTARELLEFYGQLSNVERTARRKRADALLDEVELGGAAADQPVRGYSKGMRQRLGLAQALIHDPELLVLDEPLDGLDPMGRLRLRELIAEQARRGRTVFFSSHVLGDVEAVCGHLVVLDGGSVAYEGPTGGLAAPGPATTELVVAGLDPAGLAAVAEAGGAAATPRPDGNHAVRCASQEGLDKAIDAARRAGGRIVAAVPHRATLEETFLQRFGGRAGAAAKPAALAGAGRST